MMKRGIVILAALGVIGCGVVVLAQSQTIYRSKEECFLCGDSSNSILDLYDEVDGIGVLCFNNFMVSTLGVCEEECFLQALFPQKCRLTSSKLHGEFPQYCISSAGTLSGAGEEPLQAYKVY